MHLEPILVGPCCRGHAQLRGAWESIGSIHVFAPGIFQASKRVQETPAERLSASLRVLPAETMVAVYRGREVGFKRQRPQWKRRRVS